MCRAARSTRRRGGWRGATGWSAPTAAASKRRSPAFRSSRPRWRPERRACKGEGPTGPPETMMMRTLLLAPIALLALNTTASNATPTVARAMTCPIGGEKFTYHQPVSSAALGMRPDGKPYGTSAAPAPLPECPQNGLVLYKDYTDEEVKTLEPLIASEDYQALRKTDTQYYRAYWLMRQMVVGPEDYLWALLQASWEAEGKPELRARYLAELAEQSAKVPPNPTDIDWIGMEG